MKSKWYWPYPLNDLKSYLLNGKYHNLSAISYMRQYLGEKISFCFAYMSFYTSFLVIIALPGTILQIWIWIFDMNMSSNLFLYWAIFINIWSFLKFKGWNRKNSEICARWGILQQFSSKAFTEKQMRPQFIGEEIIKKSNGRLTKRFEKKKIIRILVMSAPIFIILLGLTIFFFTIIVSWK